MTSEPIGPYNASNFWHRIVCDTDQWQIRLAWAAHANSNLAMPRATRWTFSGTADTKARPCPT
ncbi:hypothetical protein BCEP27_30854 [Burkholderia cepacia]